MIKSTSHLLFPTCNLTPGPPPPPRNPPPTHPQPRRFLCIDPAHLAECSPLLKHYYTPFPPPRTPPPPIYTSGVYSRRLPFEEKKKGEGGGNGGILKGKSDSPSQKATRIPFRRRLAMHGVMRLFVCPTRTGVRLGGL